MELGGRHFKWHMFHGIPMHYSMEVWCRQMKYHLVQWNSMELWDCHFNQCHATLDFHGIYHGIPFQMTQVFHGIPWNIPWNSMELWCSQMKYQLVPWNSMEYSMEFHGTLVPPNDISLSSMEHSMEFHGTLVTPNEVSLSSMEFHGTLRLSFYDLLPCTSKEYPTERKIPWNIPWNTMELCCRQMKYQLVPWNSMEYSMEFHGTLVPPNDISLGSMEFHGTFHGMTWNFGAAKSSIT